MKTAVRELLDEELAESFPGLRGQTGLHALKHEGGGGKIVASRESFDSQHLRQEIALVRELRASSPADAVALLTELAGRLRDRGFHQLLRRVDAADLPAAWALEGAGFELVDIPVTLALKMQGSRQARPCDDVIVRPATAADAKCCIELLAGEWWGGRYDNDPHYARDGVRSLRAKWLENDFAGRAQLFLVGEIEGKLAGYMAALFDAASRTGRLDLVATVPQFRRRGVASAILEHLIAWFSERADLLTVPTQASNYPAVQLYQRAGFVLQRSELVYRTVLRPRVEKSPEKTL